ncbi:MAG: hypothetical protein HFI38_09705 [Lachnospiraceae bacterium]|nr:hypothetical protein [Lachnospiraceae bacterium]
MKGFCFVIQPYDKGKYDKRYREVIVPTVEKCGLECYRVDEDASVEIPFNQIEEKIRESVLCIADITENNPNVWFEVGYAYACRKKLILVCSDDRKGDYPFDIRHHKVLRYDTESPRDFVRYGNDLEKAIVEYSKGTALWPADETADRPAVLTAGIGGYYEADILDVRQIRSNGEDCLCYRLDGLLGEVEEITEGETHWLFCEEGKYDPVRKGDRVRFRVRGVSERRNYRGAPNARNVYLASLKKV